MFEEIKELTPDERQELEKYSSEIKILADNDISVQFKNEGRYHAAIVLANIFNKAKKDIKIFAGDFNGDVSGLSPYLTALYNALLQGNKKLEIIFEHQPKKDSKALKLLQTFKEIHTHIKNDITISVAAQSSLESLKKQIKNNITIHFTLGDDQMYRFEVDTKGYKAYCNFDDIALTSKLNTLFDTLKKDAVPYTFSN